MGTANLEIGNGLNLIKGSLTDLDANTYCANAGIGANTQTPTAYDQAATFNGSNQYLSVASNSSLQSGGGSFTFSGWVNLNNLATQHIVAKCPVGGGASTEYDIYYGSGLGFTFLVGNGSAIQYAYNSSFNINQWNFFVAWYDSSSGYVNLQLNNGSVIQSPSTISSLLQSTNEFDIGSRQATSYVNGSISGVGFWKRVLTSNERTALYNAGNGLTYSGIQQAGLSSNLVSYWELNETSGASLYYDSVTSTGNNLTPYNTPTNSVGPIATATASSQSLINTFVKGIKGLGLWNNFVCWPLRSSQNASATQTAYSLGGLGSYNGNLVNNPAWASNGLNINSTNSYLAISTQLTLSQPNSYAFSAINNVSNKALLDTIGEASPRQAIYRESSTSGLLAAGNYPSVPISWPASMNFIQAIFNGSNSLFNINSTSSSLVDSGTNGLSKIEFGYNGVDSTQGWNGVISFASVFNINTSLYCNQLNSLYKNTIGVGLSLP